ncbi:hypothetical protein SCLCIDRAFT_26933 [Scleroderma citrinum Foug A]|uniref:Uncharacterized protein n=1 Tax=Scleroderma citrinum Foug A TaxID=1036808 RepID=A0A0C3DV33_9AGAM|nr:hypothetical protein SCLCIDRAFT_26933 [Scleroderma citrinum Foug A]
MSVFMYPEVQAQPYTIHRLQSFRKAPYPHPQSLSCISPVPGSRHVANHIISYGGTSPRPMPHDLAASRASFGAHVRWIHRLSRHYRANLELAGCF